MSIDATAVARVLGVDAQFQDLRAGATANLPMRIFVIAQGNADSVYSSDKFRATSAAQVAQTRGAGFGSPAHRIAQQLFPANGDGVGTVPVTFALLQQGYESTPATGSITPSEAQTASGQYRVVVNNVKSAPFVLTSADTVATACGKIAAAINATLDMPITAENNTTNVGVESKWNGVSANAIHVAIEGESLGMEFAVVQPSGGLVNPSITEALAQMGNVWETLVINALDIADTDALNAAQESGEGRWGALVRKPFLCFTGNTIADVTSATAVSAARKLDRINAQLVAPGSRDLPFVVCARQVARIARVANNNPPVDYAGQRATGLTPGADVDQWDYAQRDLAVKAGSSTVEINAGVVEMADTVTFYHPDGDPLPAYRFVNDIIKVWNIIFNVSLIFEAQAWKSAPLIPDNQPTTNPAARKPKSAVAAMYGMIDSLALAAILSDPDFAKENTLANIDTQNPRRLNVQSTVKISGNTGIVDVLVNWGFYLGQAPVVG